MSVKEQVLQAIQRLPEDADYRDITEEVALLAAVREAECDIADGRLVTNEQIKERIALADADSYVRRRASCGGAAQMLEILSQAPPVEPEPQDRFQRDNKG